MLIAIIRAHFSAQHAAREDKDLSASTHKVGEKGRKKKNGERKSGRAGDTQMPGKGHFIARFFICEWDLEKRHKSLKMKNPLKMPRKYL